jgi:DNA-binding transcriptional ArsR family regulator
MRNRRATHSADTAFHALSDPTRRSVLDLLRMRGVQPAGVIAESFPISRPAISKHLRILRRAHLVQEHRHGRHRFYRLNAGPLQAVDTWLTGYREFWHARLHALKEHVEREPALQSRTTSRKHGLQRRKRNGKG